MRRMKSGSSVAALQSYALAALRIVAGYMFLLHGTSKILHIPGGSLGIHVEFTTLHGWSGILELIGGALVLLGLFTRPAAFIVSGEMAVAYWIAHAPQGTPLLPLLNHGELAVLYCFVFLFIAVAGPGALSVDGRR